MTIHCGNRASVHVNYSVMECNDGYGANDNDEACGGNDSSVGSFVLLTVTVLQRKLEQNSCECNGYYWKSKMMVGLVIIVRNWQRRR